MGKYDDVNFYVDGSDEPTTLPHLRIKIHNLKKRKRTSEAFNMEVFYKAFKLMAETMEGEKEIKVTLNMSI